MILMALEFLIPLKVQMAGNFFSRTDSLLLDMETNFLTLCYFAYFAPPVVDKQRLVITFLFSVFSNVRDVYNAGSPVLK